MSAATIKNANYNMISFYWRNLFDFVLVDKIFLNNPHMKNSNLSRVTPSKYMKDIRFEFKFNQGISLSSDVYKAKLSAKNLFINFIFC